METNDGRTVRTDHSNLVGRVKNILLQPKSEWEVIDREPSSVGQIMRSWVLPLAAIPAVAGMIGMLVFGISGFGVTYRPGVLQAVSGAIVQYVMAILGVFVLALIIEALAPQFGGTKNRVQAMKVAAYSATAAWVAGIFWLLPSLGLLSLLGLYSLYLLYLGLPRLMKTPPDKAVGYTVVTILAAIVLAYIVSAVTTPVLQMFGAGPGAVAAQASGTVSVPGGGELDLEKLEQATKDMEAAAKKLEEKQKSAEAAQ